MNFNHTDELPETFPWEQCEEVCEAFERAAASQGFDCAFHGERLRFEAGPMHLQPPLVLPVPEGCHSLGEYVDKLPLEPGLQAVIVLQAGASSMGMFDGGSVLRTKTIKRYVVRGKGRAQPTHLNSKGKSRYGSRLRLQNAKAILEETNAKLQDWWEEFGTPDEIFYNAPVRLWADLLRSKPGPPFEAKDQDLVRIPRDLPIPTTEVMLRAYRSVCYGRVTCEEEGT
jgi:hypothetical protein